MSDKRQRQSAIRFRVTPTEERAVAMAAQALRVPVATFARRAAMLAAGEDAEPLNAEERLLRDFVAEIQRIGGVVRKRVVQPADADRIVHELRRLQHFVLNSKSAVPK
jgi:hypothetical protein